MEPLFALSANAADGLKRLLTERPGVEALRVGGGGARRLWFVQCTSATPVSGGGALGQCYPARALYPEAESPLPAAAQFDVLLSLFGPTGAAVAPTANAVYLCELTGPAPGDSQGRPRAFGIAQAAGGSVSSSAFSYYSGVNGIRPPDNTWVQINFQDSFPSAGTYLLIKTVTCAGQVSTLGSSGYGRIEARLWNVTRSEQIGQPVAVVFPQVTGRTIVGTAQIVVVYAATAADTYVVQARTVTGDGTVWTSAIMEDVPPPLASCRNQYVRLRLG